MLQVIIQTGQFWAQKEPCWPILCNFFPKNALSVNWQNITLTKLSNSIWSVWEQKNYWRNCLKDIKLKLRATFSQSAYKTFVGSRIVFYWLDGTDWLTDWLTDWHINQDLSYGEILAGQPGAWLVKKYIFYACNHKISKRNFILKFIYIE